MPRYEQLWRNKWLTAKAKSIKDMYLALEDAAITLRKMEQDGIVLENPDPDDDYAHLVTDDEKLADKWDLHDRNEDESDDESYFDELDKLNLADED
jgi:hypothetical protein